MPESRRVCAGAAWCRNAGVCAGTTQCRKGRYGIKAVRITKDDNVTSKIREVMDYDGPVVCEVIVQEFAPIVPRIASKVMPDGSLKAADFDDLYPFLDRKKD